MQLKPALFLDRDGVIIEEVDYLSQPSQVVLLPGAAQAIALANQRAIPVIVTTNQAGVARGYFPETSIGLVHQHLDELLAAHAAHIDRYYYCPHHPSRGIGPYAKTCTCRKPEPGMLLQAADQLQLDLAGSWLVGDKISDLQAGIAAGCHVVLVRTGYGSRHAQHLEQHGLGTVRLADDLFEATEFLMREVPGARRT